MKALRAVGLRGTVFQESFGPDPKLARENFAKLTAKVSLLREMETALVRVGVSPHAPYTVCPEQLELISDFARAERLPVMMHAAESIAEEMLLREGRGSIAERFAEREIEWSSPSSSTIQHLARHGILQTRLCWLLHQTLMQRILNDGGGGVRVRTVQNQMRSSVIVVRHSLRFSPGISRSGWAATQLPAITRATCSKRRGWRCSSRVQERMPTPASQCSMRRLRCTQQRVAERARLVLRIRLANCEGITGGLRGALVSRARINCRLTIRLAL